MTVRQPAMMPATPQATPTEMQPRPPASSASKNVLAAEAAADAEGRLQGTAGGIRHLAAGLLLTAIAQHVVQEADHDGRDDRHRRRELHGPGVRADQINQDDQRQQQVRYR